MRVFQQFPTVQYIGQIYSRNIAIGGITGQSIPLIFNWLSYQASTANPNIVVKVDMSVAVVAQKIGNIRSCYIDNTGSDVPIYVYFPDTQQTIVCQPNCTLWAPCYTAQLTAYIIGLGFFTGDIPSTYVMFSNLVVPASQNLEIESAISRWLASSTISRGTTIYNTNLGVPALGDQFVGSGANLTVDGTTQTLFNFGTGFVYVTELFINVVDPQLTNEAAGKNAEFHFFFESTGTAGVFLDAFFSLTAGSSFVSSAGTSTLELIRARGNFKLDGTQLWRSRMSLVAGTTTTFSFGTALMGISYTTNPS